MSRPLFRKATAGQAWLEERYPYVKYDRALNDACLAHDAKGFAAIQRAGIAAGYADHVQRPYRPMTRAPSPKPVPAELDPVRVRKMATALMHSFQAAASVKAAATESARQRYARAVEVYGEPDPDADLDARPMKLPWPKQTLAKNAELWELKEAAEAEDKESDSASEGPGLYGNDDNKKKESEFKMASGNSDYRDFLKTRMWNAKSETERKAWETALKCFDEDYAEKSKMSASAPINGLPQTSAAHIARHMSAKTFDGDHGALDALRGKKPVFR